MINYIRTSFLKITQNPLYKISSFAFIGISLGLIATCMDLSGINPNVIVLFILVAFLPFYICFYSIVRYFPSLENFILKQASFMIKVGKERLIVRGTIPPRAPSLSELNLPSILGELALKRTGLILVAGPSGCGKSTTIVAMLEVINRQASPLNIITLENLTDSLYAYRNSVIERRMSGTSPAEFLKRCLQKNPDVIVVGEERDPGTISIVLNVAETGHLVFVATKASNIPMAISRIIDIFPSRQRSGARMQLSKVLQAVIFQILLPRKSGMGRVPTVEILFGTPAVKNLIREGKYSQLSSIMETGSKLGMQTIDQALKDLVDRNIISYEIAVNNARNRALFEN